MYAMLGDNLGSHEMLGLSMNFSSRSKNSYWCRYCYIVANDFNENPLHSCKSRSKSEYEKDVANILMEQNKSRGQKEASVLNELQFYHTASGLPPCLGHDLFEGVIQYDVLLFLKYFVKFKWMSLNYLNFKIKILFRQIFRTTFPEINLRVPKIVSKACDAWKLLQILPLVFIDHILDENDEVWKMLLLLKKITEITCAQVIFFEQTFYLDFLVEEYLGLRFKTFDTLLRPKHHFLLHYGELTRKFGPLIRLWTMRMESKHRYSKNVQRHSVNFRNPTKSCTEKHQLLQCLYTGETSRFCNFIVSSNSHQINLNIFTNDEQTLIRNNINLSSYFYSYKIEYFGTDYKPDNALLLKVDDYANLLVGLIKCMFHDSQYKKLFFLGTVVHCKHVNGNIEVDEEYSTLYPDIFMTAFEELLDPFPMPVYSYNNRRYIIQKHSYPIF